MLDAQLFCATTDGTRTGYRKKKPQVIPIHSALAVCAFFAHYVFILG